MRCWEGRHLAALDAPRLAIVELRHALDLGEDDLVPVLHARMTVRRCICSLVSVQAAQALLHRGWQRPAAAGPASRQSPCRVRGRASAAGEHTRCGVASSPAACAGLCLCRTMLTHRCAPAAGPAAGDRLVCAAPAQAQGRAWNCRRSSSTHVTMLGGPAVMAAMMPVCGSSPARPPRLEQRGRSASRLHGHVLMMHTKLTSPGSLGPVLRTWTDAAHARSMHARAAPAAGQKGCDAQSTRCAAPAVIMAGEQVARVRAAGTGAPCGCDAGQQAPGQQSRCPKSRQLAQAAHSHLCMLLAAIDAGTRHQCPRR